MKDQEKSEDLKRIRAVQISGKRCKPKSGQISDWFSSFMLRDSMLVLNTL